MEKIVFETEDGREEFYILEQTRVNGKNYILVTEDYECEDPEVLILRDDSPDEDKESIYVTVDDEEELDAVVKIFEVLLDDEDDEAE
ncbi:MAG: DUF1292 domain-containing protein [Lachnospiraceae bacterium]|nr:DUF1292 domain-containing protein [Lachnospiraceae bacterium]